MRRLSLVAASSAVLLFGAACAWTELRPQSERAQRLYITGELVHVTDQAIAKAAAPYLQAGFFEMNIDAIQGAVSDLPWVAEAAVRRQWPAGVVIQVSEHEPVAAWGENALVSRQGRVFTPPAGERAADLPVLMGPQGSQQKLLSDLPELQAVLEPVGKDIRRVQLDARGAWTVTLETGLELRLGRSDIASRLNRFATLTVPHLRQRLETATYVDLRYADGFAIGGHRQEEQKGEGDNEQKA